MNETQRCVKESYRAGLLRLIPLRRNAGSHREQRERLNHNELAVKDSAEFTGRFGGRLDFWSQN